MLNIRVSRAESCTMSNFTAKNLRSDMLNSASMNVIPLVIITIPFALGAWLWWIMRGNVGKRTAHISPMKFHASQNACKPSPYTMQDGDVAISFRVGNRYYHSAKNRVFECIALKGKKTRLAAFGCLDSIERDLSVVKDFGGFNKVRINGGVETCERGALRADRQATAKEIAEEFEFLKEIRENKHGKRF